MISCHLVLVIRAFLLWLTAVLLRSGLPESTILGPIFTHTLFDSQAAPRMVTSFGSTSLVAHWLKEYPTGGTAHLDPTRVLDMVNFEDHISSATS